MVLPLSNTSKVVRIVKMCFVFQDRVHALIGRFLSQAYHPLAQKQRIGPFFCFNRFHGP